MRKKLRGVKRRDFQLDFDLYRELVPIAGVSGNYLSVLDIQPEGAVDTLLFVHGYAGALESWEFQINHFARRYRVVAPDLRGHGQSDAPFTSYTMAEMLSDLDAIAKHRQLPQQFVLIGHSFGGSICVEYANARPERLSKLILIATAGEYPLPRAARFLFRMPLDILRPFWRYRPRWDAELHVMKRMAANNMRQWQGWPLLRNLQTETLIITGERDRYFPREVFDEVGKMVPNAEIYDVGSAKHKVQLERHKAVNRAIERFLDTSTKKLWWQESEANDDSERLVWLSSYQQDTPATVPIPSRALPSFLNSAAAWVPKRPAILFYGRKLTYRQLQIRVNQFSNVLHGLGVRPGDRVLIALPNIPQTIIAFYATLTAGGVVVFPNVEADTDQIIAQIRQTRPRIVITLQDHQRLLDAIEKVMPGMPIILADIRDAVSPLVMRGLLKRWELDDQKSSTPHAVSGSLLMDELIRDAPLELQAVALAPEDLAVIIFTSGTTGAPKGVCLSHHNLVANTMQTRHWLGHVPYGQQVFLSAIPLMHSYGMTGAMNVPIAMGATMILLPVFEVQDVLEHIKRYEPTIFPAVPPMYAALNQHPQVRSYGLSSISACISGAAPLPIEVQEAFEKLTRGHLVEGYGLTEAGPVTHANPLYGRRKPGSIGIPISNTEAKIMDLLTGEESPSGQIGELWVRGPQIMQGYWDETTQSILKDSPDLVDGWLITGDIAVMDRDGYFRLISRKRDLIISGEYSVFPRDVEEVIYENHKVLEVAVVGIAQTDGGHKVKAYVVPRPGCQLSQEELLALCRKRLAPYAVPWEVEFRTELPKSFVGKVLRRLLVRDVDGFNQPSAG